MTFSEQGSRLIEELRPILDQCEYSAKSVSDALRGLSQYYEQMAHEYSHWSRLCDVMKMMKEDSRETK